MQRSYTHPLNFMLAILAVGIGLAVFANLLANGFNLRFGLVLFVLGVLFMGVGNILSLPARRYERQCGIRHTHIFKTPAPEEFIAGNLFVARTPAHFYSIENALLFAGFVILIIGLFILL